MSEVIAVARLTRTDLMRMRALNALFSAAFEDEDAYSSQPPREAYLAEWLSAAHHIALIADRGGELAGGLVAYELDKFEQARREIYIYDLAVAEPHRRHGVATALIEALKAIARERSAYVVYVQADPPDAPAVALYDKLGVREDVFHFDIEP